MPPSSEKISNQGHKNAYGNAIFEDIPKVEECGRRHRQASSGTDLREPAKIFFDADSESSTAARGVCNVIEMVGKPPG